MHSLKKKIKNKNTFGIDLQNIKKTIITFSIWVLGWRVLEEVKYSHVDPPVEEPE